MSDGGRECSSVLATLGVFLWSWGSLVGLGSVTSWGWLLATSLATLLATLLSTLLGSLLALELLGLLLILLVLLGDSLSLLLLLEHGLSNSGLLEDLSSHDSLSELTLGQHTTVGSVHGSILSVKSGESKS
jgi:hypothetical protein